jgi:hypothetical protein
MHDRAVAGCTQTPFHTPGRAMPLTDQQRQWYFEQIKKLDPRRGIVTIDEPNDTVIYNAQVQTNESRHKPATPEELVHALALCMLASPQFNYPLNCLFHEKYCRHGRSSKDDVDIVVYDADNLPFAMWELKSTLDFDNHQAGPRSGHRGYTFDVFAQEEGRQLRLPGPCKFFCVRRAGNVIC